MVTIKHIFESYTFWSKFNTYKYLVEFIFNIVLIITKYLFLVSQLIVQIPWSHFIYLKAWTTSEITWMILKMVCTLNNNGWIYSVLVWTILCKQKAIMGKNSWYGIPSLKCVIWCISIVILVILSIYQKCWPGFAWFSNVNVCWWYESIPSY